MAVMTKRLTDSVIFAYPTFLPWYLIGWRPKVGHHVFKKQEWKKGFRNLKKKRQIIKSDYTYRCFETFARVFKRKF